MLHNNIPFSSDHYENVFFWRNYFTLPIIQNKSPRLLQLLQIRCIPFRSLQTNEGKKSCLEFGILKSSEADSSLKKKKKISTQ